MTSVLEKKENNVVVLTIEVSPETFAEALQRSFQKNAHRFNIPGFRKGKAPMHLVTRYYGEGVLYDDAIDFAANPAYQAALAEHNLKPVSRPDLDIQSISREGGMKFTVQVTVRPDVTLGQYLGVEAVKPEYAVTDEDVERDLQRTRERNARLVPVEDRAIQAGDIVNIDYEGFIDGVPFEGGKGDSYDLTIGSNTFIPGFEDALIGKMPGDSFELPITFPEDYHTPDLAGREAVFNVHINHVKYRELPELDDEFAKDVSEFDTLEEYRASIRQKLEENAAKRAQSEFEENVIRAVVRNATVDIPSVMIEQETDQMVDEQSQRMHYQGFELEQYLGYIGQTMDSFREQLREAAEERVRTDLVLEAIAAKEGSTASEEEIDAEIGRMAELYGMSKEDLRSRFLSGENSFVAESVVRNKTIALLTEKAVAIPQPPEPEADEESAVEPDAAESVATDENEAATETAAN